MYALNYNGINMANTSSKIILSTHGSSGDLNPFIALGKGLQARGHRVELAVSTPLLAQARAAGFVVHDLPDDETTVTEAFSAEIYGGQARRPGHGEAPTRAIFERGVLPTLPAKVDTLRAACADADLLVAITHQHAAAIVAELTGIAWATLTLTPLFLPSTSFSPVELPLAPPAWMARFSNRLSWEIGGMILRPVADRGINAVRARYGLPPGKNLLLNGNQSHQLTALVASPAFMPRQPDWPPWVAVTGFLFWDGAESWQEPPELAAFFASEKPVVAISSGSMAPAVKRAFGDFYRTSLAAVHALGARALVIGAAPGTLPEPLPPDTLALPFAPFSQIYPRCAAVIHHGGMGTTAQALRAGVPMLIVPWGGDQFFSGAQVQRLGVGAWVRRPHYTHKRAVALLRTILDSATMRAIAQRIAQCIAHEDGVATLSDRLEAVLRTRRQHVPA